MGKERQITMMTFYVSDQSKPWKTNGIELTYKCGHKAFLGWQKTGTTQPCLLTKQVRSIKADKQYSDQDGTIQHLHFYDDQGNRIGHHRFWSPAFSMDAEMKLTIDKGLELIGASVTTDENGFITWINYLTWPTDRPFV